MSTQPSGLPGVLLQLLQGAGQGLANALSAQGNPIAYQQQEENQRQQAQLAQQQSQFQQQHALQQAQLARQQQQDANQAGIEVWNALAQGATKAAPGQTPDVTIGGVGLMIPPPPKTYTIVKDSPVGKSLGLTEDLTGLSQDSYLKYLVPQIEKLSIAQDKQTQLDANSRALDLQVPTLQGLIRNRFSALVPWGETTS